MVTDANMQVPPPGDTEPVKAEVYCIRGETVSIGGAMEWIIAELARRFAHTTEKKPKRQWGDLKRYIKTEGLNPALQDELGDVTGYFRPRNLAAHAGVMIVGVAEATQIFRLYRDKGIPQVELVTLDELNRKSTRLNSSHTDISRMPSSA